MTPQSNSVARLYRLAQSARSGQWNLERDIDWSRRPRLPFWMRRAQARKALSQLYHGELATSSLCEALLADAAEDRSEVRSCLGLQLQDERRHAAAYGRYLKALGGIDPLDDGLQRALSAARHGPFGNLGAMLAYHVVIEGELLRLHGVLAQFVPCPLLRDINRLVGRDEARHVAFGKIYLAEAVQALSEDERRALYIWLEGLWQDAAQSVLNRRRTNLTIATFFRRWLGGGWARHADALAKLGLPATTGKRQVA